MCQFQELFKAYRPALQSAFAGLVTAGAAGRQPSLHAATVVEWLGSRDSLGEIRVSAPPPSTWSAPRSR